MRVDRPCCTPCGTSAPRPAAESTGEPKQRRHGATRPRWVAGSQRGSHAQPGVDRLADLGLDRPLHGSHGSPRRRTGRAAIPRSRRGTERPDAGALSRRRTPTASAAVGRACARARYPPSRRRARRPRGPTRTTRWRSRRPPPMAPGGVHPGGHARQHTREIGEERAATMIRAGSRTTAVAHGPPTERRGEGEDGHRDGDDARRPAPSPEIGSTSAPGGRGS